MKEDIYVYSIGKEGIEIVKAEKPRITKYTNSLVEVTLDNYQVIRCTPDHRFMLLS
jgi:intein/homing endonuclease